MKILIYGYYDDFANFFMNIRDYHKQLNPNTEYYFLTPNLSGYFTWSDSKKYLLRPLLFQSADVRVSKVDYLDIIALFTLQAKKINPSRIQKKIACVEKVLLKVSPDIIIISGDVRPNPKIISKLAERYKIPVLFFEQGPLKTTLISSSGVTANHIPFQPLKQASLKKHGSFTVNSYNINRKKRLWDVFQILSKDPESSFDFKIMIKKILKKKNLSSFKSKSRNKKILFALQVPNDINWVFHSGFHNIKQVITYISQVVPADVDVIFREHPMYSNSYGSEIYSAISNQDNFYLDTGGPVNWEQYTAMLAINSLMTFEAVSNSVPVGLLGKSCYANIATDCRFFSSLSIFIKKAIIGGLSLPSEEELASYISTSFLFGHYRNITPDLLHQVVAILEENR